ncbi:gamma-glutamylcyclotransferase family protein [Gimesia aquarii]|uniref:Gamma-glutamylcyclotransferase AIG2-like domain-containing protein n=1 Tax=Gimesia aquarii TaxID=2527964 RepID=A0A517VYF9_9PLAN|nr:gamma-glutamylcyclotransferase family protein [Gimesia aquarii]QDT98034.1 hypothetical protein V144x_35180 [Gimesia aquarii]
MAQFLFVYGSLIGSDSECLIGPSLSRVPARVIGLQRGWFLPIPEDCDMGLGVVFQKDSTCNGVVLEINSKTISEADEREIQHGYSRVQIPSDTIIASNRSYNRDDKVWAYITNNAQNPSNMNPIAQSYIDVVLSGCIEISKKFAKEFVETTHGWEFPWIDDRQMPRYRRAISTNAEQVDELLEQVIPTEFARRRVI